MHVLLAYLITGALVILALWGVSRCLARGWQLAGTRIIPRAMVIGLGLLVIFGLVLVTPGLFYLFPMLLAKAASFIR